MVRKVIMLVVVVLVMGLSLLAIQCDSDSNKFPKEKLQGFHKELFKEGLQGIDKQFKMPAKGFY
ncbi:hypothetical protein ES708_28939 [subsurface metagenome]